jgi:hypothetical protein
MQRGIKGCLLLVQSEIDKESLSATQNTNTFDESSQVPLDQLQELGHQVAFLSSEG